MCIHEYIYLYIHVYLHMYICICICIYVYIHVYIIYINMYIYIYSRGLCSTLFQVSFPEDIFGNLVAYWIPYLFPLEKFTHVGCREGFLEKKTASLFIKKN